MHLKNTDQIPERKEQYCIVYHFNMALLVVET